MLSIFSRNALSDERRAVANGQFSKWTDNPTQRAYKAKSISVLSRTGGVQKGRSRYILPLSSALKHRLRLWLTGTPTHTHRLIGIYSEEDKARRLSLSLTGCHEAWGNWIHIERDLIRPLCTFHCRWILFTFIPVLLSVLTLVVLARLIFSLKTKKKNTPAWGVIRAMRSGFYLLNRLVLDLSSLQLCGKSMQANSRSNPKIKFSVNTANI